MVEAGKDGGGGGSRTPSNLFGNLRIISYLFSSERVNSYTLKTPKRRVPQYAARFLYSIVQYSCFKLES